MQNSLKSSETVKHYFNSKCGLKITSKFCDLIIIIIFYNDGIQLALNLTILLCNSYFDVIKQN